MSNFFEVFQNGANALVSDGFRYGKIHAQHGLSQSEWDLLTQNEIWTQVERRKVRSILSEVINVSLTIAGLPSTPLPGQYVAAIIAKLVAPCNRIVCCQRVPETYDAMAASGLSGTVEVNPMSAEQMVALVLAYSGYYKGEPRPRVNLPVEDGDK